MSQGTNDTNKLTPIDRLYNILDQHPKSTEAKALFIDKEQGRSPRLADALMQIFKNKHPNGFPLSSKNAHLKEKIKDELEQEPVPVGHALHTALEQNTTYNLDVNQVLKTYHRTIFSNTQPLAASAPHMGYFKELLDCLDQALVSSGYLPASIRSKFMVVHD